MCFSNEGTESGYYLLSWRVFFLSWNHRRKYRLRIVDQYLLFLNFDWLIDIFFPIVWRPFWKYFTHMNTCIANEGLQYYRLPPGRVLGHANTLFTLINRHTKETSSCTESLEFESQSRQTWVVTVLLPTLGNRFKLTRILRGDLKRRCSMSQLV